MERTSDSGGERAWPDNQNNRIAFDHEGVAETRRKGKEVLFAGALSDRPSWIAPELENSVGHLLRGLKMILLEKANSAVRDFLWAWLDGKKKGREQVSHSELYNKPPTRRQAN